MIFDIKKTIEGDILSLNVVCLAKTFLTDKTNILTTEKIIDIIEQDYIIEKLISQPSHKVGNTTRSKIRLSGTWSFKISKKEEKQIEEKQIEEKQIEEKPKQKRKYTRKPKPKQEPSSSIRNRISNLSKKN